MQFFKDGRTSRACHGDGVGHRGQGDREEGSGADKAAGATTEENTDCAVAVFWFKDHPDVLFHSSGVHKRPVYLDVGTSDGIDHAYEKKKSEETGKETEDSSLQEKTGTDSYVFMGTLNGVYGLGLQAVLGHFFGVAEESTGRLLHVWEAAQTGTTHRLNDQHTGWWRGKFKT